jgi:transcriptional regulator with XRE-family HTH domain
MLQVVAKQSPARSRGTGGPWSEDWQERALAAIKREGTSQRALAEQLKKSPAAVSRCISGEVHTFELAEAISTALKIAPPWGSGDAPPDLRPTATDSDREIVRKNLIRFRDEVGIDPRRASIRARIALDELEAYERGERDTPRSVMEALAPVYGRRVGDFIEREPPPRQGPSDLSPSWWGIEPELWARMSAEERARFEEKGRELDAIVEHIDEKYRPAKKALAKKMPQNKAGKR